jgi:hypothetical protein
MVILLKNFLISTTETLLLFVLIFGAVAYSGCLLNNERNLPVEALSYYDDSGISLAIRNHFGENLGQVVSVQNHTATTAEAIVSLTKPKPDFAKLWMTKKEGEWEIDNVVKQYVID